MTTLKAPAVLAWILAWVIVAPPAGAGAHDGATEAWARAVVQSTITEWSEAFVARGQSYRPTRLVFTRLPRQLATRGEPILVRRGGSRAAAGQRIWRNQASLLLERMARLIQFETS